MQSTQKIYIFPMFKIAPNDMRHWQDDSITLIAVALNMQGTEKENLANDHTCQRQTGWG
jgi:hypothetical protein